MPTPLILNLITAITPLSLIIIWIINRLITRDNTAEKNITTICTNVVGTLTKKNLLVKNIYYNNHDIRINLEKSGDMVEVENTLTKEKFFLKQTNLQKQPELFRIAEISAYCHYPKMKKIEHFTEKFLLESQFPFHDIKEHFRPLEKLPSDNNKKISTVVVKSRVTEDIYAFSKGNPKKLLEKCNRILEGEKKIEITPSIRRKLKRKIDNMNKKGQKVIAFAYKGLPRKKLDNYTEEFTEKDLVFVGLIGLAHPINHKMKESIREVKEAGIKTFILSGVKEKKVTALGIQLGLINENYFEAITGEVLREMPDQKVIKLLKAEDKDYLFAELHDRDKKRILKLLEENGEKVASISSEEDMFERLVKKIKKGRIFELNFVKNQAHSMYLKGGEILFLLMALLFGLPLIDLFWIFVIIELTTNILIQQSIQKDWVDSSVMTKDYQIHIKNNKHLLKPASVLINSAVLATLLLFLYVYNLLNHGFIYGENLVNKAFSSSTLMLFLAVISIYQIIGTINITKKSLFSNVYMLLSVIIILLGLYFTSELAIELPYLPLTMLSNIQWMLIFILLAFPTTIFILNKKLHFHE